MARRARWIALLLLATLAWATGGCLGGAAREVRTFRLTLPEPAESRAGVLLAGTLLVERPRTDALLNERALVFRASPDASELRQYAYTRWVDAPAVLVQQAMVERLDRERVADRVLRAGLGSPADWTLVSRIDRFERVGGEGPVVEVALELAWLRASSRDVLHAGHYRVSRRAGSAQVEDAVAALGVALGEALDLAVADLAGRLPRSSAP
ncbi:MAG: ABC-type transport auxiliary lipoprotein family protein [Myxococcota bacterium]